MTKPLRDAAAETVRRLREFNEHPDPGALDRFEGVASEHAPALADWATRTAAELKATAQFIAGEGYGFTASKLLALVAEFDGEGRRDG